MMTHQYTRVRSQGGQYTIVLCSQNTMSRVTKSEHFPDSKIFVAKTFQIKRVNCFNFQIRIKGGFTRFWVIQLLFLDDLDTF